MSLVACYEMLGKIIMKLRRRLNKMGANNFMKWLLDEWDYNNQRNAQWMSDALKLLRDRARERRDVPLYKVNRLLRGERSLNS